MTRIAFLDLETTGLPERKFGQMYEYKQIEKYETCRVVQIALIVAEYDGAEIILNARSTDVARNFIIKPAGFAVKGTEIHGITHERAMAEGIPIETAAAQIKADLRDVTLLVAHNIEFDKNVLLSELFRIGDAAAVTMIDRMPTFCTMARTTDLVQIRSIYGNFKWPKLTELYYFLFREHVVGAHNAKNDVAAVARCFTELLRRGLIVI
jgi:DNA polymerase-3 subunit epsilon